MSSHVALAGTAARSAAPLQKLALVLLAALVGALITAWLLSLLNLKVDTDARIRVPAEMPVPPLDIRKIMPEIDLVKIDLPLPPPSPRSIEPIEQIEQIESIQPTPVEPKSDQPKPVQAKQIAQTAVAPIQPATPAPSHPVASRPPPVEPPVTDIHADDVMAQAMGMTLLKKSGQHDRPEIRIGLPENARQQSEVVQVLRRCLGVSLGKISAEGHVLARENQAAFSPYLRLVEGRLSDEEQLVINQWRDLPGSIVRIYPEAVDARVLGGLFRLVDGRISHAKITGQYQVGQGTLKLTGIRVNGQAQARDIVIARTCG